MKLFRRLGWTTPKGFFTPFHMRGDPALDRAGVREDLYRRVFSTADGRVVLADMLSFAGVGVSDYEVGMPVNDAIFRSGIKWGAIYVARLAGLETGALGRALVTGRLEAMATHGDENAIPDND